MNFVRASEENTNPHKHPKTQQIHAQPCEPELVGERSIDVHTPKNCISIPEICLGGGGTRGEGLRMYIHIGVEHLSNGGAKSECQPKA